MTKTEANRILAAALDTSTRNPEQWRHKVNRGDHSSVASMAVAVLAAIQHGGSIPLGDGSLEIRVTRIAPEVAP